MKKKWTEVTGLEIALEKNDVENNILNICRFAANYSPIK